MAYGEGLTCPTYYILSRRENYVWGLSHHLRSYEPPTGANEWGDHSRRGKPLGYVYSPFRAITLRRR